MRAISDEALAWMSDRLPGSVESMDLEHAYAFEHALNADRRLERFETADRGGATVFWRVQFTDPAGIDLLDGGLARRVFATARLCSTPHDGAVALNARFVLLPNFRRRGFGRILYSSEEALYRKWGVREIHLRATEEGRRVWLQKFGFLPRDPEVLKLSFQEWSRRRGRSAASTMAITELPAAFLDELSELYLYKVLQ